MIRRMANWLFYSTEAPNSHRRHAAAQYHHQVRAGAQLFWYDSERVAPVDATVIRHSFGEHSVDPGAMLYIYTPARTPTRRAVFAGVRLV